VSSRFESTWSPDNQKYWKSLIEYWVDLLKKPDVNGREVSVTILAMRNVSNYEERKSDD
jgi:hypothetical protein